jgi:quercetin dioxygenase-like cupin family protein
MCGGLPHLTATQNETVAGMADFPAYRNGKDNWIIGGTSMLGLRKILLMLVPCTLSVCVHAGGGPLLDTPTSWDEGSISYPQGQANITAVILRIEEGDEPPFHCHPVPTMGYVLKGEIEVETSGGKTAIFKQGDSVVEVMRTVHRGKALQAPVEIVVFYAGAEGIPTTVLPADDPNNQYCDA